MKKLFKILLLPLLIAITFTTFMGCEKEDESGSSKLNIPEWLIGKWYDIDFIDNPSYANGLRFTITKNYICLHQYNDLYITTENLKPNSIIISNDNEFHLWYYLPEIDNYNNFSANKGPIVDGCLTYFIDNNKVEKR